MVKWTILMCGIFSFFEMELDLTLLTLLFWSVLVFLCSTHELSEGKFIYVDQLSLLMVLLAILLTCFVLCISKMSKSIMFGLFFASMFFSVKSMMWLYIFFEMSLIPMLFIILGESMSPERIPAGKYMVMYALIFSAPLLGSVLYLYSLLGDVFVQSKIEIHEISPLISIGLLLGFMVKVPLFLSHSWLPRAHVEAPLKGSIFLAGILLKVGVYGFIRILTLLPKESSVFISDFIFSLSMVGSVYSMVYALMSDDAKVRIAYSSVSHMNMCVAALLPQGEGSLLAVLIIMMSHGMISTMLFFLVGKVYECTASRSLLIWKGIIGKFPLVKGFFFSFWIMNIGVPPFFSFLGEMNAMASILSYFSVSWVYIVSFVMVSSSFSLLSYSATCHSSCSLYMKFSNSWTTLCILASVWIFLMVSLFFWFSLLSM